MKMLETRQVIQRYLENNFGNEPDIEENKKFLRNYLQLLNKRYRGFRKLVISFYNLNTALSAF